MSTAKKYNFPVQTPQGPGVVSISADEFKQCPCGSELFQVLNRVAWLHPRGIIGAEPMCLKVEVFVCNTCGREISHSDKTIRELQIATN